MTSDHYVVYCFNALTGEKFPRRTGPFGEEAATAFAREVARKSNISAVVIEKWSCVSVTEVWCEPR